MKQRRASAENAAKATAARITAASERRAQADATAMAAYSAVETAVKRTLDALPVDRALALAHARHAMLLLATVGAGPGFDMRRSRSIAAALRAAFGGRLEERVP